MSYNLSLKQRSMQPEKYAIGISNLKINKSKTKQNKPK